MALITLPCSCWVSKECKALASLYPQNEPQNVPSPGKPLGPGPFIRVTLAESNLAPKAGECLPPGQRGRLSLKVQCFSAPMKSQCTYSIHPGDLGDKGNWFSHEAYAACWVKGLCLWPRSCISSADIPEHVAANLISQGPRHSPSPWSPWAAMKILAHHFENW